MRSLAAGFFTFALIFALTGSGCGVNPKPSSAPSCSGCCDESGECLAGTGLFECGATGARCARCAVTDTCRVGSCEPLADAGIYDGGMTSGIGAGGAGGGSGAGAEPEDSAAGAASRSTLEKMAAWTRGPDAGTDAGKPDAGFDGGIDAGGKDAGLDGGRDGGDAG